MRKHKEALVTLYQERRHTVLACITNSPLYFRLPSLLCFSFGNFSVFVQKRVVKKEENLNVLKVHKKRGRENWKRRSFKQFILYDIKMCGQKSNKKSFLAVEKKHVERRKKERRKNFFSPLIAFRLFTRRHLIR